MKYFIILLTFLFFSACVPKSDVYRNCQQQVRDKGYNILTTRLLPGETIIYAENTQGFVYKFRLDGTNLYSVTK